jgi:hypothetical protein
MKGCIDVLYIDEFIAAHALIDGYREKGGCMIATKDNYNCKEDMIHCDFIVSTSK